VLAGIVAPLSLGPLSAAVVLCILSVAALTFGFKRAGWFDGPARIERIEVCADGHWQLVSRTGRAIGGHLTPATRIYRRWLWLSFASGHVLLCGPGDLDTETGRRLRVLLRKQEQPELPVPGRVA
jgi:hypothetical protein